MLTSGAHKLDSEERTKDVYVSENINFEGLLLSEQTLTGLTAFGFERPSPIQYKAIPFGRCGFDLIAQAKSGTGKTCMFGVIALEMLQLPSKSLQVLILAPTREIAAQVADVITSIGQGHEGLQVATFIGGMPLEEDRRRAKTCHIAVGSPGRVKQLIDEKILDIEHVRLVVLDEADKLLEPGFLEDINHIFSLLPESKQTLAASATYTDELKSFLENYMRSPIRVSPDSLKMEGDTESNVLLGVRQIVGFVTFHPNMLAKFRRKLDALTYLLSSVPFKQCLVFNNLHGQAESMSQMLKSKGFPTEFISGHMEQPRRLKAIASLVDFKCRVLLSTDLSARGLDAANVDLVINMDIPQNEATYLHRVGRAGRFGSKGLVITLSENSGKDIDKLCNISTKININFDCFNINVNESLNIDLWNVESMKSFDEIAKKKVVKKFDIKKESESTKCVDKEGATALENGSKGLIGVEIKVDKNGGREHNGKEEKAEDTGKEGKEGNTTGEGRVEDTGNEGSVESTGKEGSVEDIAKERKEVDTRSEEMVENAGNEGDNGNLQALEEAKCLKEDSVGFQEKNAQEYKINENSEVETISDKENISEKNTNEHSTDFHSADDSISEEDSKSSTDSASEYETNHGTTSEKESDTSETKPKRKHKIKHSNKEDRSSFKITCHGDAPLNVKSKPTGAIKKIINRENFTPKHYESSTKSHSEYQRNLNRPTHESFNNPRKPQEYPPGVNPHIANYYAMQNTPYLHRGMRYNSPREHFPPKEGYRGRGGYPSQEGYRGGGYTREYTEYPRLYNSHPHEEYRPPQVGIRGHVEHYPSQVGYRGPGEHTHRHEGYQGRGYTSEYPTLNNNNNHLPGSSQAIRPSFKTYDMTKSLNRLFKDIRAYKLPEIEDEVLGYDTLIKLKELYVHTSAQVGIKESYYPRFNYTFLLTALRKSNGEQVNKTKQKFVKHGGTMKYLAMLADGYESETEAGTSENTAMSPYVRIQRSTWTLGLKVDEYGNVIQCKENESMNVKEESQNSKLCKKMEEIEMSEKISKEEPKMEEDCELSYDEEIPLEENTDDESRLYCKKLHEKTSSLESVCASSQASNGTSEESGELPQTYNPYEYPPLPNDPSEFDMWKQQVKLTTFLIHYGKYMENMYAPKQ